jgi:hypothetical protein
MWIGVLGALISVMLHAWGGCVATGTLVLAYGFKAVVEAIREDRP